MIPDEREGLMKGTHLIILVAASSWKSKSLVAVEHGLISTWQTKV